MLPGVVVVVGVLLAAQFGSVYLLSLLAQVAIFALVVTGLNLFVGYAGQVSFGNNAFFGIGAYGTAYLTTREEWPPLLALLISTILAIVVAVVVGWPALRLHGHYLALATFILGLGFYTFAEVSPIFGGFAGIAGIPPMRLGPVEIVTPSNTFLLLSGTCLVGVFISTRLKHLRFGRSLRSIAGDELIAGSVGVHARFVKTQIFAVSAAYAAIAGALYATSTGFVSAEAVGFQVILLYFIVLFIGGVATTWGPVLGATVVVLVPEFLPINQDWEPTYLAVLLLVVLILRPSGLLASRSGSAEGSAKR